MARGKGRGKGGEGTGRGRGREGRGGEGKGRGRRLVKHFCVRLQPCSPFRCGPMGHTWWMRRPCSGVTKRVTASLFCSQGQVGTGHIEDAERKNRHYAYTTQACTHTCACAHIHTHTNMHRAHTHTQTDTHTQ